MEGCSKTFRLGYKSSTKGILFFFFFFAVKVNNAGYYKKQKNSLKMKAILQINLSFLTIFLYEKKFIYLFTYLAIWW